MKINQIIENKFREKPINIHIGGYNGRHIPDELKKFFKTHVKKSKNGSLYVSEHSDSWYFYTFGDNSPAPGLVGGIHDFKSFMNIIKPYFSVQKIISMK